MLEEIWKDVQDYPGYQVSNLGNVRSSLIGNGKLSFEDIQEIRKLKIGGVSTKIISEKFKTHYSNISYILSGKTRSSDSKYRMVKFCKNNRDYIQVNLFDTTIKKGRKFLVHRLVALTFLEHQPDRNQVNHKNGDKSDNRLENLEFCNNSENHKHAYDTGLRASGEKHHSAKLTDLQILKIKELIDTKRYTNREIAKIFDIADATISKISKNKGRYGLIKN